MRSFVFYILLLPLVVEGCLADTDINERLLAAVNNEDMQEITELVHKGADVNFKPDHMSTSPLAIALGKEDLRVARLLVQLGANVDERDGVGYTFLIKAAIYGNQEIARFLIENGADVNARSDIGFTPLSQACYAIKSGMGNSDYLALVKLLLNSGADIALGDDRGFLPIHFAAARSQLDIIDFLIEKGADVNSRANDGRTPLYYAIVDPNPKLLKFLLDRGADPNIVMHNREHNGLSYLQIAKELGNNEIIDLLKGAGAMEFVQDDWESTE